MKIYVITDGEYSDYHIITATTDEKMAKSIAKRFDANIEEYEDAELIVNMKSLYFIRFDESGTVVSTRNTTNDICFYRDIGICEFDAASGVFVTIEADSLEEAIKIAAEKRAKFLAEKFGIA